MLHACPVSKGWQSSRMRGRSYQRQRQRMLDDNQASEHRGMCHLAIPRVCTGKATQIHHTLGIARTGHDPKHMVPACAACNLHVGDPATQPDPPHMPVTQW